MVSTSDLPQPGRLARCALDQPLGDGPLGPMRALEEDTGLTIHAVGQHVRAGAGAGAGAAAGGETGCGLSSSF
jgi:hypothetical protein